MILGKRIDRYMSIISQSDVTEPTYNKVENKSWFYIRDSIALHIIEIFQQYNNIQL